MGTVASAREFLAAGCAMAVVLLTAGGGGARMLPAKACPLDTTKVESAMETAVGRRRPQASSATAARSGATARAANVGSL